MSIRDHQHHQQRIRETMRTVSDAVVQLARRRVTVVTALVLALACVAAATLTYGVGWTSLSGDGSSSSTTGSAGASVASDANDQSAATAAAQSDDESAGSVSPAASPVDTSLAALAALDGSAAVSTVGFEIPDESLAALQAELDTFASYGYGASVALVDVSTGAAISVDGGTARYSASAIKGPFVLSLAASGTIDADAAVAAATYEDDYVRQLVEATVTVSDNDAYATLFETYWSNAIEQWAADASVTVPLAGAEYLDISAIDMARLWTMGYGYLFDDADNADVADSSGSFDGGAVGSAGSDSSDAAVASEDGVSGTAEAGRAWLADAFSDTLNSSIHMALVGDVDSSAAAASGTMVYTKAGWINGEGGLYALNDAGIVRSASGDYILAVMTDACGEYGLLTELITLLDTIHAESMAV